MLLKLKMRFKKIPSLSLAGLHCWQGYRAADALIRKLIRKWTQPKLIYGFRGSDHCRKIFAFVLPGASPAHPIKRAQRSLTSRKPACAFGQWFSFEGDSFEGVKGTGFSPYISTMKNKGL